MTILSSHRGPVVWTRGSAMSQSYLADCDGGPLAAAGQLTTADDSRPAAGSGLPLPHTCLAASTMRVVDQESWPLVPLAAGCRMRDREMAASELGAPMGGLAR